MRRRNNPATQGLNKKLATARTSNTAKIQRASKSVWKRIAKTKFRVRRQTGQEWVECSSFHPAGKFPEAEMKWRIADFFATGASLGEFRLTNFLGEKMPESNGLGAGFINGKEHKLRASQFRFSSVPRRPNGISDASPDQPQYRESALAPCPKSCVQTAS